MPYDPTNNPYLPGDPYSYDLKWMVQQIQAWQDPLDSAERAEAAAETAEASIDAAAAQAAESEAWAKGTKDGYPVTADDPQYENNSKYWADQSAGSAQEAKDYADNIADPVSGIVTDWLTDHITNPTSPPVDTSLSIGGAAADAAVTGEEIGFIQDTELNYEKPGSWQASRAYRTGAGDTVDLANPTTNSATTCTYLPCQEGDIITLDIRSASGTNYRPWGFIDAGGNYLSKGPTGVADYVNHQIEAPAGTSYIIINAAKAYPHAAFKGIKVYDEFIKIRGDLYEAYKGKKLSLLGDSISAFSGYSTDGHNYYPNAGSDVSSVDEMWWKIVADKLGMDPLVIGAWSGSCVTSGVRSDSSYKPASDPYRCEGLNSGGTDPDVILIAMGVNDYSYMDSTSEMGTWDGKTRLGTQADLSDYVNTDFRSAYATMLARIQYTYPDAFIVCITPWFNKRYSTSVGVNFLNAIGKDLREYADTVREICRIMHVACIDGTNIGFNWSNYYPTYANDSSVHPTHPTVAGQAAIAKAIIKQLLELNVPG